MKKRGGWNGKMSGGMRMLLITARVKLFGESV